MEQTTIQTLLHAYEQLNTLGAAQLVNTVFRDIPVSDQAFLIGKRRTADNLLVFISGLNDSLQWEINCHLITLAQQHATSIPLIHH